MLTRAPRHDLGEKGPGCWVLSTSSASVTDKPGKEDPDDPKGASAIIFITAKPLQKCP